MENTFSNKFLRESFLKNKLGINSRLNQCTITRRAIMESAAHNTTSPTSNNENRWECSILTLQ